MYVTYVICPTDFLVLKQRQGTVMLRESNLVVLFLRTYCSPEAGRV